MLSYHPERLSEYTHILLDEVHERTVDSDFLCLIVKILLGLVQNKGIKLIVMSATMQKKLYSEYFTSINGNTRPQVLTLDAKSSHQVDVIYIEDAIKVFGPGFKHGQSLGKAIGQFSVEVAGARAELTEPIKNLCLELILKYAQGGETILVFLPGHGEIIHMQEILERELFKLREIVAPMTDNFEAYTNFVKSVEKSSSYYEIHILHGLMPQSQMKAPLNAPPVGCRRIILATNVAESSLTVANVNVVIDTGLRKLSIYDYEGGFSRLVNSWCSKASIQQRLGRTGRVCNGRCFRLFTKEWEERVFRDYDMPDTSVENFARVLLFSKRVCENFFREKLVPDNKPSSLLSRLPDPPAPKHMKSAILELHQSGLTVGGDLTETAPLSILGMLATRLQLDIGCTRIVYYAWMMGFTVEGIVMASACSMDRDVFKYPRRLLTGDEEKFSSEVGELLKYRELFDDGCLSEPISALNVLKAFIATQGPIFAAADDTLPPFNMNAISRADFDAFKCKCECVAERFEQFVNEEMGGLNLGCEWIPTFRYLLNRFSVTRVDEDGRIMIDVMTRDLIEDSVCEHIDSLFQADSNQLKFILALALNRRIFHAPATGMETNGARHEAHAPYSMEIRIRSGEDGEVDADFFGQHGKELRCLICKIFGQDDPQKIQIEFPTSLRDEMIIVHIKRPVVGNKILAAREMQVALQFFDRRRVMFKLDGQSAGECVYLYRPRVANMVNWAHLIPPNENRRRNRKGTIPVRVNVKHPIGWLLVSDVRNHPSQYFMVSGNIQGMSTPPNENGDSWITDTRADYATLLPTIWGGSLAFLILLITQPFRNGLEAVIAVNDSMQFRVEKLCLDGKWFAVNPHFPITMEILGRVAGIRDLVHVSTNLSRDTNGETHASLERIREVMRLMRSGFNSVCEFAKQTYKTQIPVFRNWKQRSVQLVDTCRGPGLITDARCLLRLDTFSVPKMKCMDDSTKIDQKIIGQERMASIGWDPADIQKAFPTW